MAWPGMVKAEVLPAFLAGFPEPNIANKLAAHIAREADPAVLNLDCHLSLPLGLSSFAKAGESCH
jgi:hypothetical protein